MTIQQAHLNPSTYPKIIGAIPFLSARKQVISRQLKLFKMLISDLFLVCVLIKVSTADVWQYFLVYSKNSFITSRDGVLYILLPIGSVNFVLEYNSDVRSGSFVISPRFSTFFMALRISRLCRPLSFSTLSKQMIISPCLLHILPQLWWCD